MINTRRRRPQDDVRVPGRESRRGDHGRGRLRGARRSHGRAAAEGAVLAPEADGAPARGGVTDCEDTGDRRRRGRRRVRAHGRGEQPRDMRGGARGVLSRRNRGDVCPPETVTAIRLSMAECSE